MILAAHNAWTYLKPKSWWMKLLRFTARCQDHDIRQQYDEDGVRCFDLRVRFDDGVLVISHGIIKYNITEEELMLQLQWLNRMEDVAIRLIHEVRHEKDYTQERIDKFVDFCKMVEKRFSRIKFWCGMNLLPTPTVDYEFPYHPTCEEKYASVCAPKLIDDWYPRWFAKKNNHEILEEGTDKDMLMIDFVNIR